MGTSVLFGQFKVHDVNFESGFPSTWSQVPSPAASPWLVGTNGITRVSAYTGDQYAALYSATLQAPVKLITDLVDIGSLTDPVVNFWYVTPSFSGGSMATLRVYYRTTTTGNWIFMEEYTGAEFWTREELSLAGIPGYDVQVAFEYSYGNGRGVGLDDVYVGNLSVCSKPSNLRANNVTDQSALLSFNAYGASLSYQVKISTTPISDFTSTANVKDTTYSGASQIGRAHV